MRPEPLQGQMGNALHDAVMDSTEEIMKMLSREIKSIEKNIHELVEDNKDLHNSFELATFALFDSGLKAKYHQKAGEGKPKMSV